MNETSKSLTSAAAIIAVCSAVIGGLKARDLSELRDTTQNQGLGSLLASNDKQVDIAEGDYYAAVVDLLEERYVDPVTDEKKMLSGAIKGMITGLRDIDSQFFNPNEFEAYKSIRAGRYPGIGVWLDYKPVKSEVKIDGTDGEILLPRLSVIAVAPGSSAAKMGVLPGDIVYTVDGSWVTNSEELLQFRKAQFEFAEKKIDFKALNALRKDLKLKLDKSLMPAKAREKLVTGKEGKTTVIWIRNGKKVTTNLEKGETDLPRIGTNDGTISLLFTPGAAEELASLVKSKSEITIDLRNNVLGDYETMRKCLGVLGPTGTYGFFETKRSTSPLLLKIEKGNPTPPKVKLLVDSTTRDIAEIFALALSSKGVATLSGKNMGESHKLKEIAQNPDGSGYAMVTGEFRTGSPGAKPPVTKAAGTKVVSKEESK